jgi:hypothetical protein
MADDRFPAIWMASSELRDLRALRRHRDQWVLMRKMLRSTHGRTRFRPAPQDRLQNVSTTRVESAVRRWTAVNETELRNGL